MPENPGGTRALIIKELGLSVATLPPSEGARRHLSWFTISILGGWGEGRPKRVRLREIPGSEPPTLGPAEAGRGQLLFPS